MVKLREGIVTYTYSVSIGYNMRTCNTFFFYGFGIWFFPGYVTIIFGYSPTLNSFCNFGSYNIVSL